MDTSTVDDREILFEREGERRALASFIERAAGGAGGVLAVEGPPGIGKTRLLAEIEGLAQTRGWARASARGASLEQDFPFGAVRQLFEGFVVGDESSGGLFEGAAGAAAPVFRARTGADVEPASPGAVLHGLYWMVVALAERSRPLVLVCDDVHWFDAPSLRFLAYLANRVAELPVAVVVGTRPPEPTSEGVLLSRVLALPGVEHLRPAPLTVRAVGDLVRASMDDTPPVSFCAAVAEASNGNPFIVSELVRAARAAGPTMSMHASDALSTLDVDDAVLARIGYLRPEAMEVAKAVAVLGADAHLRHVASLAGLPIDDVGAVADELLRAHVLGAERPLAFVHPLVGAAVYGSLLPGDRSARHRRVVALLRAEGTSADRLANHLMVMEPAGDPAVVSTLVQSAAAALALGATDVAIDHLRRARSEPPAPDRRIEVVLRLAVAESLVNDPGAIEDFEEVIRHIPNPATQLKLATASAAVYSMQDRPAEGVALLRSLGSHGDVSLRLATTADVLIASVLGRIAPTDFTNAINEFRFAVGADPSALESAPSEVLAVRAYIAGLGGERCEDVERWAMRALHSVDPHDPMLPLWFNLVVAALVMVDRDSVAAAAIESGLTSARRAGAPAQVGVMLFHRSMIAFRAGDLDDAEVDATAALDICVEYGLGCMSTAPLSVLVEVLRERDRLDEADEILTRYGFGGPHDDLGGVCIFDLLLMASRARLRGAQGRWDEALADLEAGWAAARACSSASVGLVPWAANLAFGLVLSGRMGDAAAHARTAVAEAESFGAPRALAEAKRALALAGEGDVVQIMAEVDETFRALGARLEAARSTAMPGFALREVGVDESIAQLTQAAWLAEQCGATRLLVLSRARLKQLGARMGRRPVSGIGALTASERRVAQLALQGHTNKAVAQELYVTVKTVETHLARVYQKLAISSRAGLSAAMSI